MNMITPIEDMIGPEGSIYRKIKIPRSLLADAIKAMDQHVAKGGTFLWIDTEMCLAGVYSKNKEMETWDDSLRCLSDICREACTATDVWRDDWKSVREYLVKKYLTPVKVAVAG